MQFSILLAVSSLVASAAAAPNLKSPEQAPAGGGYKMTPEKGRRLMAACSDLPDGNNLSELELVMKKACDQHAELSKRDLEKRCNYESNCPVLGLPGGSLGGEIIGEYCKDACEVCYEDHPSCQLCNDIGGDAGDPVGAIGACAGCAVGCDGPCC
jgi:hypothetical protein